jgi:hypothetical protein
LQAKRGNASQAWAGFLGAGPFSNSGQGTMTCLGQGLWAKYLHPQRTTAPLWAEHGRGFAVGRAQGPCPICSSRSSTAGRCFGMTISRMGPRAPPRCSQLSRPVSGSTASSWPDWLMQYPLADRSQSQQATCACSSWGIRSGSASFLRPGANPGWSGAPGFSLSPDLSPYSSPCRRLRVSVSSRNDILVVPLGWPRALVPEPEGDSCGRQYHR